MTQQPVLIQLPDSLYSRIRQAAEASQRPIEEVLVESLALMFDELPGETELTPQSLEILSDAQLWAIVYRPLAWPLDTRLRELTELGKRGLLSEAETNEMEQLIHEVDRFVLLRSQGLFLLKERGYEVESRLHLKPGA